MASVNSRSGLFTKGGYSPTGTDENMANDDIELQVRVPQKAERQPSYENMDDRNFTEDDSHQYEEPEDIHRRKRGTHVTDGPSTSGANQPKKKAKKAGEAESTDGYRRTRVPKVFKVLAFGAYLFALAALIMVILLMVGVLSAPSCRECTKELVPGQEESSKVSETTQERLWKVIKDLKSNVSKLNAEVKRRDKIISKLQSEDQKNEGKIAELQRKANYRVFVFNATTFNISSFLRLQPSVKGDTGSEGKIGKTVPGNMTLCRYLSEEGTPFTLGSSASGNVIVTEPQGYRIVGATCSTVGASEYNLKSELNSADLRQYECECRGKSSVFKAADGRARCIMHYWMCASYY